MNRSMNVDPVADTNCHEVLSHFQGSAVTLASHRNELVKRYRRRGGSEQDDMRVDGKPRLHAFEERPCLLRRGVIVEDLPRRLVRAQELVLRRGHFVNHHVRAFGELDEVFAESRITRNHDGSSSVVNPVPHRGSDRFAVIDGKRRDLHAIPVVNSAFRDVLGNDGYAARRKLLVGEPAPDIQLECLFEIGHQVACSRWSGYAKRLGPPAEWSRQPSSEPEVRDAHHMIGMEMRQKYRRNFAQGDIELPQPLWGPSAAIDQEPLGAGLNEYRGAEAIDKGPRRPRSEQRHLESLALCGDRRGCEKPEPDEDDRSGLHVHRALPPSDLAEL